MWQRKVATLLRDAATLSACALLAAPASAELPSYQVKDLGSLGGRFTEPADLNDVGQVTGYSETADGQIHAFLYDEGELRDLSWAGGGGSLGRAINEAGEITGFAVTAAGEAHAFRYTAGLMTDLGTAGTASRGNDINGVGQVAGDAVLADGLSHAALFSGGSVSDLSTLGLSTVAASSSTSVAINDAGEVVGTYDGRDGSHAFLVSGAVVRELVPGHTSVVFGHQAINGAGQVTGSFQADSSTRGFLYQEGRVADLGTLGGDYGNGLALNAAGNVTGIASRADGERHAFIYSGGTMTDLGALGGTVSIGYAINDSDEVTGAAAIATGVLHAFAYADGRMLDLHPLLEALGLGPVLDSVGYDINNGGQVIGKFSVSDPSDAERPARSHAFIATPIARLFASLLAETSGIREGRSLVKKIERAMDDYAAGDRKQTCHRLSEFLAKVSEHHGRKIAADSAVQLAADAGAIGAAIGCPAAESKHG